MKGFLACVLASVPLFISRQLKGSRSTSSSLMTRKLTATGVRPLIAPLDHDLPRPRVIIVGEPTNMTVIEAHKRNRRLSHHGHGARSSFEPAAARRCETLHE
jgi:acetylornithine deacetylase